MDLTPLDIRKKKDDLRRVLRGYDADQVEAFLDVCAERLDEPVADNDAARAAGRTQNAGFVLWGRAPEPGGSTPGAWPDAR